MNPEQAKFVADLLIPMVEDEYETTRKVLAAIPDSKPDYRPDPKARTAFELAWHIASSEIWFIDGLVAGQFPKGEGKMPEEVKTAGDVLRWYEARFPVIMQTLKGLDSERLARKIDFFGVLELPASHYLVLLIQHSVHHRGQLSTYLRPMGSKVPSIYGGSADEPWQPAPQG